MPYSYQEERGDGVKRSFTLRFEGQDSGYISESNIHVSVNGASVPFVFLSSNTIEIIEPPPEGSEVLIRRVMDKDRPYADFKSGNNFGQDALNNSFLQLLYIIHELLDGYFPEGFTFQEAVNYLEGLRSVKADPTDPHSVVNFSEGDKRYVSKSGDSMTGPLLMQGSPIYVRSPEFPEEPVRLNAFQQEVRNRNAAIESLQAQLGGREPLAASAFSPVSWHDRVLNSRVVVPPGKNAFSYGPDFVIGPGGSVRVEGDSSWIIADGYKVGEGGGSEWGSGISADYDWGLMK